MKKFIVPVLAIVIGFFSCNNPTSKNKENANLPDTTGYFAARNMKGLGTFKIGESTYSEILKTIKEEIRKDSRRYKESNYKDLPRYSGYESKYLDFKFDKNGNIASQFYREDFGSIFTEVKYDTINSYLKKDILEREIFGCPNIRETRMYNYYIGDIELSSLELKFYKDTLYQINCYQNDKVEEGFKAKYGGGRLINNTEWETPSGRTNIRPENDAVLKKSKLTKIDEKIIWENELLKAESQTYCEYKYDGDEYKGAGYSNSHFIIISKNERILNEIKDCENSAYTTKKRMEEQSNQKDINQL